MECRLAHIEETEQIMQLYTSVLGQPDCTWDETYPSREFVLFDIQNDCLYVLSEGNKLYAAISVVPENELQDLGCWHVASNQPREIARVVVDRKEQGKGYASCLLGEVLSRLQKQGCESVRLLVAQKNNRAYHLYRSFGFTPLRECFYYGNSYYLCEKLLFSPM